MFLYKSTILRIFLLIFIVLNLWQCKKESSNEKSNTVANKECKTYSHSWTKILGTTASDSAWGISSDGDGNIYVSGQTSLGSLPEHTFTGEDMSVNNDAFIVKLDSSGMVKWSKLFGSTVSGTKSYGTATDKKGNIYMVGTYHNSGSSGYGFVRKYNSSGAVQWTENYGNNKGESVNEIKIIDDRIFIMGSTVGSGFNNKTTPGVQNVFVCEIEPDDGSILWTVITGSSYQDTGYGMAIDLSNELIYVTGVYDTFASSGEKKDFLSKITFSGAEKWLKTYTKTETGLGYALAVDKDGNIFASDTYETTNQISKLDSQGAVSWNKTMKPDSGKYMSRHMVSDTLGNVYLTGTDTSPGSFKEDVFVFKYDSNGNRTYKTTMTAHIFDTLVYNADIDTESHGTRIALDKNSNIIIAGRTYGLLNDADRDYPDYPNTDYETKTSNEDMFVVLLQCEE